MSTVSFPVTLTGDYLDGSVCSAADYRADFEKLRDAINQMHGRFSTTIFTGHDITYQDDAEFYEPAWGASSGGAFGVGDSGNDYKILNVIKIPGWMQGIRVRNIQLCNFSRLPAGEDASWTTNQVYYVPDSSKPLKFGVAYGAIGDLAPDAWGATDIASITLDTDAKVRGPYQYEGTVALKADSVFEVNKGYSSTTANVVVPPGQYLVLYATGKVHFRTADSLSSGGAAGCQDLNWHFALNVLCDTMIPIP
jgi:hypothetical protein